MNEQTVVAERQRYAAGAVQPAATHAIALAIHDRMATATLCRPPVNAVDDAWVARLNAVLDEAEADPRVSVLWIRSSQRVFCAGADLEFMRSRFASEAGRAGMIAFTRRLQEVYARIERSRLVSV